jgi:hypothetical protein
MWGKLIGPYVGTVTCPFDVTFAAASTYAWVAVRMPAWAPTRVRSRRRATKEAGREFSFTAR